MREPFTSLLFLKTDGRFDEQIVKSAALTVVKGQGTSLTVRDLDTAEGIF